MTKGRHTKSASFKLRCSKCNKRAKDIIDGEPLCRLHSPMREGFKALQKKQDKKEIKKKTGFFGWKK